MTPMTNLKETLHYLSTHPDYTNLATIEGVRVDLKYGSTDNFMGKNVYGPFTAAFLHRKAAEMLRLASSLLGKEKPGTSLVVLDALRPRSVQFQLWNHVVDTPQQKYVGNPVTGSVHNFGFAIDLTVAGADGVFLDMGTSFDAFEELSEPRRETEFLQNGRLTREQVENRLLLRRAMTGAGFIQLPHEWWHYDALPPEEVRKHYPIIE